ncbi:TauD/TfdA family dioxygenase [Nocardiopsis sp. M1B1]|uniref:TauD/TfdA family dioxygenase n=1 Tax=Nocardiopsis sp. M1B1 TaxID=3450454 RepID=UPI004039D337
MSDDTVTDLGWNTEVLEERRSLWSLPLEKEDTRLLAEAAAADSWEGAEEVRDRLRAFAVESVRSVGFAHVRGLVSPDAPYAVSEAVMRFVLRELGEVIPQNAKGDLTHVLRDQDGDGATELGFHCDTCDVLVLLCLQPAVDGGGDTKLASARTVRDTVAGERPDVLATLEREWTFDRTGRAGQQVVVSPILFVQEDGSVGCYYQPRTVRTSPERGGPPLSADQWEALGFLDEVLYRPEIAFRLRLEAGELLLIRNNRVMHGRSPYVDVPGPRARRVLRAWMSTEVL